MSENASRGAMTSELCTYEPKLNVFSGLKAGDFHCWSLTFQADTKNVPSRVYVAIMRATATRAFSA
jgi:hypothetical protein